MSTPFAKKSFAKIFARGRGDGCRPADFQAVNATRKKNRNRSRVSALFDQDSTLPLLSLHGFIPRFLCFFPSISVDDNGDLPSRRRYGKARENGGRVGSSLLSLFGKGTTNGHE